MSLTTLLIILLVVLLVGGPYLQRDGTAFYGAGHFGGGALGLVLVVLIVLLALGRL